MKLRYSLLFCAILIMLVPQIAPAQSTAQRSPFRITGSSPTGMDISFQTPAWQIENYTRDGEQVSRISLDQADYLYIDEEQTLPVFSTCIAIPNTGNANLAEVMASPALPYEVSLDFAGSLEQAMNRGEFPDGAYPGYSVRISEPSIVRDYRIVSVNVSPFAYDPALNQLTVSQNLSFRISFDQLPAPNELAGARSHSRSLENVYRALILNYDEVASGTRDYQSPSMLVIYGNYTDATYLGKVNEFVAWKRQIGYEVVSVAASSTGAGTTFTAIKNYIQNAYNTWQNRPEYIVLIGDVSGTIAIPTLTSGGEGDYQYTWLAGNDVLGDAVIGRISVSNLEEMLVYMAKMAYMDRDVNTSTASDWLNSMLLVGDTASSGISTVYTNRYIHDLSVAVNPYYTYTELYQSGPSPSAMNTALNAGVGFFNYRGYIGMSGWNTTYINQLNNGYKMFHAVIITCATGNFASTATTESVVRKGTAAALGGAITAIGMSTSSTHTPMNNCLSQGIFHGIFSQGMRNMGEPLYYSKLYLHSVYGVSNPTQAQFFAQICNLIGDPTVAVYIGVPEQFNIAYLNSIPAGSSSIDITVRDGSHQIEPGARVTLANSTGLFVTGYTDETGRLIMEFPSTTTGTLTLTVAKGGFKPSVLTITINSAGGPIYESHTIDDDNSGSSSGNGNGSVNSGETVECWVTVRNTSSASINISGEATGSDPYVSVATGRIGFPVIPAGGTAQTNTAVVFSVASDCPDNHLFILTLSGGGSAGYWSVSVPITVRGGGMELQSFELIGSNNNLINPGDIYPMTFTLQNTGYGDLAGVQGILRSYDTFFSIQDSLASFGTVNSGAVGSNGADPFTVYARGQCIDGMTIPLELYLYNSQGYGQSFSLSLTIGQTTVTDPLGQDAYGYFIFDMGDVSYPQCPSYNWIGIAPAEGGSGTALSLTDPGSTSDEGDQTSAISIQTVTLPFPFKYYGIDYNQISISSNGFIAFGATQNSDWRNWRLPGPGGPNPMLAVFWDDLQLNTGSYVYRYYDSTQHYYVVEWYNVINGYDRVTPETFQAILYDPVYYPTQTGDGQIKMQYKVFNNIDQGSGDTHPHGNFATIGIKDQTGTIGLEYSFNNQYPTAAQPLGNQKALFITTKPLLPQNANLTVEQVFIFDANDNGHLEPGESANLSVRLINNGLSSANDVTVTITESDPYVSISASTSYYGTIPGTEVAYGESYITIEVAPNCPQDHEIVFNAAITCDEGNWNRTFTKTVHKPTIVLDAWLIDDLSANANGIFDPGETVSFVMNVLNESEVQAEGVAVSLSETSSYLSFAQTNLALGDIPGGKILQARVSATVTSSCPAGTSIPLTVNITSDNAASASSNETLSIGLINLLFTFETDNGGFTDGSTVSPGWEWGTSTYAGAYSGTKVWGTVLNATYANSATYALVSPPVNVGTSSQLSFYHRYNIETNYDGAQCRISTNGGSSWSIIYPTAGYSSSNLPALSGPGYHGTQSSWTQVTFNLASYAGQQVRFKWLMMTDASVVREGWFIDNVQITNSSSGGTSGKVSGMVSLNGGPGSLGNAVVDAGEYQCPVDGSGYYQINLPVGQYTFLAELPGYSSSSQTASVSLNSHTQNLNLNLSYLPSPDGLTWLICQDQLSLRWDPVSSPQPSAYRIYEKKGTGTWQLRESTQLNHAVVNLDSPAWYEFKLVALYTDSESLPATSETISNPDDGNERIPAAPVNISAEKTAQGFNLSWDPVVEDTVGDPLTVYEYRIYASDSPGFEPGQANYLGESLVPAYLDAQSTQRRFYKILAVRGHVPFP
jgi:hypothetical protein